MTAAEAFSPKLLVLGVFLAAATYVHLRGRVRHKLRRQLTDHSTLFAPYSAFAALFSAVPRRPVLDVAAVPELGALRADWQTIRREALALLAAGHIRASERYDDLAFHSFFRRGWQRFYLKWYGGFLPSARALCPRTVELLERTHSVRGAMFALLPPRSRLGAHRDPFAGALRYHLGLATPNSDRCRIFIDGTPYTWRDGEDLLFDETYVHSAENETDEPRIILFCDVERPLRGRVATAINRLVGRFLLAATATRNVEGDRVGALNRVFACVHHAGGLAARLKRANARAYYAAKYGVLGGLVYALLS